MVQRENKNNAYAKFGWTVATLEKYHNILCPSKFCISIVSMQNLGGQSKSIMVFSEVAY